MGSVVGIVLRAVLHVEEVLYIAVVWSRRYDRLTILVLVAGSGNRWCTSYHSEDMLVSLFSGLVNVLPNEGRIGLGVEGG